jgi:membrane protease YdiL (CAAX protease family)
MTTLRDAVSSPTRDFALEAAVIGCVCLTLAFRPIAEHSAILFLVPAAVAFIGRARHRAHLHWPKLFYVAAVGVTAFTAARLLGSGYGVRYDQIGIAVVVIAAISEEFFFRGFLHDRLHARNIPVLAICVISAVLFAVIHIGIYGLWVLPIDLSAGALLAWQREASGTWIVPAFTHAIANLMQIG